MQLNILSCYDVPNMIGTISKPDLVAVGTNVVIPSVGMGSGTSISAPMVTAAIACLISAKPSLMTHPEYFISLLTGTASPVIYDDEAYYNGLESSGFDSKMGAGSLNIDSAYKNIDKVMWFPVIAGTAANSTYLTRDVTVNGFKQLRVSIAWLMQNGGSTPSSLSYSDHNIRVKNPYGNIVEIGYLRGKADSTYNTIEIIDTYLFGSGTFKVEFY